ncbi:MAG: trypsin-like serine protease [Myxococcota bacterium]|nr:trypsin-like serine protease [Myxococcota bacterium]
MDDREFLENEEAESLFGDFDVTAEDLGADGGESGEILDDDLQLDFPESDGFEGLGEADDEAGPGFELFQEGDELGLEGDEFASELGDAEELPETDELDGDPFDYQVIGRDDRKLVRNTTSVPWRWICKLEPRFPGSSGAGICTGALIAPNKVLTAAHCLYSRTRRAPVRSVRVVPGKRGPSRSRTHEPFGSTSGRKVHMLRSYQRGRTRAIVRASDYAVITLRQPIGRRAGQFPRIRAWSASALRRGRYTTAGYPGDKNRGTPLRGNLQYMSGERILRVSSRFLEYAHDTFRGQSGSPVWAKQGNTRTIVGVHVRADDPATRVLANVGIRITPGVLRNIQRWVRAT